MINDVLLMMDFIPGFLAPGQEQWLFQKALSLPNNSTLLEIGSHFGRSSACLGLGCLDGNKKLICFDLWNNQGTDNLSGLEQFYKNMRILRLDGIVRAVKGDSAININRMRDELSLLNISLVFIDGDHHYNAVKRDFEAVRAVIKPGCWVAFHDVIPNPTDENRESMAGKVWNENVHNFKNIDHCNNLYCGQLKS